MPKRKNIDKNYEVLCKKLKLIEEKLGLGGQRAKRRRGRIISSSSDSSHSSQTQNHDSMVDIDPCEPFGPTAPATVDPSLMPAAPQPSGEVSATIEPELSAANIETERSAATVTPDVGARDLTGEYASQLDPDVLEILGVDPTASNTYGKDIQKDLAIRMEHCATEGLPKDDRKNMVDSYLLPNNCKLIGPPNLNPELKAALSEQVIKRDKAIESKQRVLSAAISSLAQAITLILSSKEKDANLLRLLMDTSRMLCDCQHSDTLTRRNYVINSIKKEMKESLHNTKIDTSLFGQNLPDTLKAAKAINKSGAELKINPPPKPGTGKKPTPSSSKNWKNNVPRKQTMAPKETTKTTMTTRNQRSGSSKSSHNHRHANPRR
ncbi:uncharacterized protein LOC132903113 [Amyelois transitella]|uniref:uncharacterized protein LOC132903113 n=1 Tax=Amyelois transitella TaxID=680683 RepID=UPI00298FB62C|nr:uncharacterized protein LOC132903113 [Amyelois transitella]